MRARSVMSVVWPPANSSTGIEHPLLAAADELGRRLNNIRNDNFFAYLGDNHKRELALSSTLFRFAQYFAWVEIVYGFSDRLRFASDQATVAVSRAIGDIAWTLAADEFDRKDPNNFTTSSLMLWREEQRAIGEMMRQDGVEAGCISFARFATTYEDRFSRWFTKFAADLEDPSSPASDRLANLHRVTARLVRELDVDRTLVELDKAGELINPRWARAAAFGAPTRHTDAHDRR